MQHNFDENANARFYPGQGKGTVTLTAPQASVQSFPFRLNIPHPSSPSSGEEEFSPKSERQGSNRFSPAT